MPNETINKLLLERKIKNRKIASYRKNRIVKHYHKLSKEQQVANEIPDQDADEGTKRKMQFYQQVFAEGAAPQEKKEKKQKGQGQQSAPQVEVVQVSKLDKLKKRKKNFIKKMQTQKTQKGQPVMRNYIKYALTKLEETLEREKIQKKSK